MLMELDVMRKRMIHFVILVTIKFNLIQRRKFEKLIMFILFHLMNSYDCFDTKINKEFNILPQPLSGLIQEKENNFLLLNSSYFMRER
jgi:hypothetical protein